MTEQPAPESPARLTGKGLQLRVRVTPGARRNQAGGIFTDPKDGALLQVAVTAPPEDGKANAAVIALLAKLSGIPKSAFVLERGATNRHKTFHIDRHDQASLECLQRLAAPPSA